MNLCEIRDDIHSRLTQLGIPSPGIACSRDYIEFNPLHERPELLRRWLVYRGFGSESIPTDPTDLALEEINRPGPPFSGFDDFDANVASEEFMRNWLSWFGVATRSTESRREIIKTVQKLQKVLKNLNKKEAPIDKFRRLLSTQRRLKQKERALGRLHLLLQNLPPPKVPVNAPLDAHEKENLALWTLKMFFATSLNATAIAAPLLLTKLGNHYQQANSKKGAKREKEGTVSEVQEIAKQELPSLAAALAVNLLYSKPVANAVMLDVGARRRVPTTVLSYFTNEMFAANPSIPKALATVLQRITESLGKISSEVFARWVESRIQSTKSGA